MMNHRAGMMNAGNSLDLSSLMPIWNADEYARHSSQQQQWARELIGKLKLKGDERVLDIGCGDGKVTAELAGAVPLGAVVGVDSSTEMIRYARQRFAGISNLRFDNADAVRLEFQREFDVVFSNAALHWIVDHRPALRGIAAALKPAGRVLLQMGGQGNADAVLQVMDQVVSRPQWSGYFDRMPFPYGFHSPEQYRVWLKAAGLTPRRVELISKDMLHPSRSAFAGWIRTTWLPWTHRLPDQLREPFVEQVVEGYLSVHSPDVRGQVHVPMVRLEVEACLPICDPRN